MRHVKQLIYGIFYLAIWAGLIGGIYAWQRPTPTCFDGVKNQNEIGIDCGGVCSKVCVPKTISPLVQSGNPKLILLGSPSPALNPGSSVGPRASVVSQLQNNNLDFAASSFEYSFDIYDQGGAVIASFPGRSFIYGGEIKRLTLLNALLPAGSVPIRSELTIKNPIWTPIAKFPKPELRIQVANTSRTGENLVTQGTLINQDSVDFSTVYIIAEYYDASGAVVGITGTERNNVASGESREFTLFHPTIPDAVPERTQVFVTALNFR